MTQIEQIKAEIERRMLEDYNGSDAQKDEIAQGVCAGILTFINSLPQKEANAVWHDAIEKPKPDGELTKEWCEKKMILVYHSTNKVLIHKAYEYLNLKFVIKWAYIDDLLNIHKQEPVSEDLELASERYACKFSSSKYGHNKVKDAVIWGANWQKEQMMKGAVESVFIQDYGYAKPVLLGNLRRTLNVESRDKVKLIVIKED